MDSNTKMSICLIPTVIERCGKYSGQDFRHVSLYKQYVSISDLDITLIIHALGKDDEFLVNNTCPKSPIQDIRDELIIRYDKLTNSNIMSNIILKRERCDDI